MSGADIVAAIGNMTPDELAPVAHAAIARMGVHGRDAGLALAHVVPNGDSDFDEGAEWVKDVAEGNLVD